MYKIHINNKPLYLISNEEFENNRKLSNEYPLVAPFPMKRKFLFNYVDLLEKKEDHEGVVLLCNSVDAAMDTFKSLFKIVEAAGGIVYNQDSDELLFIYRKGIWDLPKGKIEKNEERAQAAVREVIEETGLSSVELGDFIYTSWHTYTEKNKRILKPTYWYKMRCSKRENSLTPQVEEGISELKWMRWKEFKQSKMNIYPSLSAMLDSLH